MNISLFEWLFKFSGDVFSEGDFIFEAGKTLYPFLVLLFVLIVVFIFVYFQTNIFSNSRTKAVSLFLKILGLLLLCLPLFEPGLIIPDIIPNENFLAVLIDNSSSMKLEDGSLSGSRAGDVRHILLDETVGIRTALEENFKVRYYSFDDDVSRVDSVQYLTFNGPETNISKVLQRTISDFRGLPLAGVLLLTDGGDNSLDDPQSLAEELGGLTIPIHVVGLGSESFEQERELLDVSYTKGLRKGAEAEVWVKVRSWNEEQNPVTLNVYNGESVVHSEVIHLQGNGKTDNISFFFEPDAGKAEKYELRLEELPGEINTDNNVLNILIDTRKDSVRVLYFEGHLRSDFKFIKRALENDQVFEFTSLTRTGGDKYYRQGIKHKDELKGGFPILQEELFKFKALILGDIEASYFTIDQLEMIERFVSDRGGGFLMLGAKNSFVEGGYWNTPIANILPVVLDPTRKQIIIPDYFTTDDTDEDEGFSFVPTRTGYEHPILKFTQDIGNNRALWDEMNDLTHISLFGGVKPGAAILAEKPAEAGGSTEPLLVIQRYGKGQTAALATASTWRWQMQRDAKDRYHERFWRQLVRWLVASTPDQVTISLENNVISPDKNISLRVNVFDRKFDAVEFAELEGTVTDPFGSVHPVTFYPDLSSEGEYTASYIPEDSGVYTAHVSAQKNGTQLGNHTLSFLSHESKKEFFNATLKKKFLQNMAAANGGVYYEPSDFSEIPENLILRKTSTSVFRTEYLWDMPLLYLLALIVFSAEWFYRRRKGLP